MLHNDLATEEVSLVMVYLIETKVFQEVFYLVIDVQVYYFRLIFLINSSFSTDLAFGSIVTLKNTRAGGALLHSHHHLYPKEHPPEQQQVSMF